MPGRDGTGPLGRGAMSGKGLGLCTGVNAARNGNGSGLGRRRGYGRNLADNMMLSSSRKELLLSQKELLEKRLHLINKQIESK
ncbi:DUF5320 domain-containing protein [Dehalobacter sp. TBBPA1]|uniref:DUF5320 domain-containing protein n=1 Tax=Dehalobacter sp. TBBPA1 TaxID=3235037 RepID=UPI0034A1ED50